MATSLNGKTIAFLVSVADLPAFCTTLVCAFAEDKS